MQNYTACLKLKYMFAIAAGDIIKYQGGHMIEIEGLWVLASSEALCCVLEQETSFSA